MIAYVLAGGLSTRMGRSKALLPWRGATLIEHQVAALKNAFGRVEVVASPSTREELLPLFPALLTDQYEGKGPLAGIHAAMQHTVQVGFTRLMVLAVDLPGINADFLQWIDEQYVGQSALVCRWEGREQPLCGIYSFAILPALEEALSGNHFGVLRFLNGLHGVQWLEVREDVPGWHPLLLQNVNAPEDFKDFGEK